MTKTGGEEKNKTGIVDQLEGDGYRYWRKLNTGKATLQTNRLQEYGQYGYHKLAMLFFPCPYWNHHPSHIFGIF